jgi:hypothetical protein
VSFSVHNPNNFQVEITDITADTITADNSCSPTGMTFTDQHGLSTPISALGTIPVSGSASMGAGSASACQGATFTIPVTVTVKQS